MGDSVCWKLLVNVLGDCIESKTGKLPVWALVEWLGMCQRPPPVGVAGVFAVNVAVDDSLSV